MDVQLRRWSGKTYGEQSHRLIVKSSAGDRIGTVDLDRSLLHVADERDRAALIEALARHGVTVRGPESMAPWTGPPLSTWPAADGRVQVLFGDEDHQLLPADAEGHLYDPDSGQRVPPRRVAMYDPTSNSLDVCHETFTGDVCAVLRRIGLLSAIRPSVTVAGDDSSASVVSYEPGQNAVVDMGFPGSAEHGDTRRELKLPASPTESACAPLPEVLSLLPTPLQARLEAVIGELHHHSSLPNHDSGRGWWRDDWQPVNSNELLDRHSVEDRRWERDTIARLLQSSEPNRNLSSSLRHVVVRRSVRALRVWAG